MSVFSDFLVLLVALLHGYFMVLEMLFWTKPLGLKVFAQTAEQAALTKTLAANQGLYNGFLAAGLLWGLVSQAHGFAVTVFFLSCVIVAGGFGAITVNRKIFFVQALPALMALILVCLPQSH